MKADEGEVAAETPAYQNQAQVAHDANLAEAAYAKIDAEIVSLQEDLTEAEAEANGDLAEIAAIEAEIDAKVSERTGIEEGRIADLRASGMNKDNKGQSKDKGAQDKGGQGNKGGSGDGKGNGGGNGKNK